MRIIIIIIIIIIEEEDKEEEEEVTGRETRIKGRRNNINDRHTQR